MTKSQRICHCVPDNVNVLELQETADKLFVESMSVISPVLQVMNALLQHNLLDDYVIGGGVVLR